MPAQPAHQHSARLLSWSKLASAIWEDAWIERLRFLGQGRLAIFALPGSRRIRIEAYALSTREAALLTSEFGGSARPMKTQAALLAGNGEAPPLRIRGRLVIARSARSVRQAARARPGLPFLIIPAVMAFGTGDHATTATCLRMVADFARAHAGRPWRALDLGAGTGILALAARALGAARCDAWDFDPACIRAIRSNIRLNGVRNIAARRVDVTAWPPTQRSTQWQLVTANLYSQLLASAAPRIAAAVAPGGSLILSGMLASQSAATLAAFRKLGVRFTRIVPRGKWITALGGPALVGLDSKPRAGTIAPTFSAFSS